MRKVGVRSLTFYALATCALLVLVFKLQYLVVPDSLAVRIGHNSEVLGLTILICLLIQYVRPWALRSVRSRTRILWVVGVLAALVAGYFLMRAIPLPTVSTLDECFSGAAYVWLYMMIPKRFRSAPAAVLLTLLIIVVFFQTTFVLEQAESLVPLLIAPIALDVMDRTILDPSLPERPVRRIVWILVLAAVGLAFMAAAPWARADLNGVLPYIIDYGQRASEAYWSWILIHLYFGYVVPPRLRVGSVDTGALSEGAARSA